MKKIAVTIIQMSPFSIKQILAEYYFCFLNLNLPEKRRMTIKWKLMWIYASVDINNMTIDKL